MKNNESVELDSYDYEEDESDMTANVDQKSRAGTEVKDGDGQGSAFGFVGQRPLA